MNFNYEEEAKNFEKWLKKQTIEVQTFQDNFTKEDEEAHLKYFENYLDSESFQKFSDSVFNN